LASVLFKENLNKKGYVVKNVQEKLVLMVTADVAFAKQEGIDKKERERLQKKIDKMPNPKVFKPYQSIKK